MRTKSLILAVVAVAAIASAQAYALTGGRRPESPQATAETKSSEAVPIPGVHAPDALPQAIVAGSRPQAPVEVETVIVGFKPGLGDVVRKALVRTAGAIPTDTVSGPETIVATIDRAELDSAAERLEANLLVDYVAVATDDMRSLLK